MDRRHCFGWSILARTLFCLAIASTFISLAQAAPFPGTKTRWHGFDRYQFPVDGKTVSVVVPRTAAPGRPWVWHGEFFGHKPEPDIELLKRGFHIVYLRVPDLFGSPTAVAHWNACYRELTTKYHLAKKVALVGLSRGGLYCYNWAAENPDCVACIYGDAPVCDFKSWPGGWGTGQGSRSEWKKLLQAYGFRSDEEAKAYPNNPVDRLEPLALAGVPLLHIYGEADKVVPWQENTAVVAQRYRKLGGSITLIAKPGVGHHPHGLVDVRPIVDFIVRHALPSAEDKPLKRLDAAGRLAAELEPSRLVVYKTVARGELFLHVFEPSDWKPSDRRPCFLVFHGGGWMGGQPRRMYPFADHFARKGMVAISAQYRLRNPRKGITVFDCVKDARSAMRFVRSHAASLGIDPDKIIVSGASAGGHLAAGVALFDGIDDPSDPRQVPTTPAALVLYFPVIDTSARGYGQSKIGDRWQELSPVHHVRKGVPPTILFQGTADTVTPPSGARAFHQAMIESGNRCELVTHEGGKHGYLMFRRDLLDETLLRTDSFLKSLGLMP